MSVKISNRRTASKKETQNNEPEPSTQTTIKWEKQPVTFLGPKEETEELNRREKVENLEQKILETQATSSSKSYKKIV